MNYVSRQAAARARMAKPPAQAGKKADERVDALLLSHLANVRYLCGFTGSNGLLLLTASGATLFTDGRYREQAAREVQSARVVIPPKGDLWKAAAARLRPNQRVAIEGDHVTLSQRQRFLGHWSGAARQLHPISGWIESQRAIKEPEEIAALRRAVELASSVFLPTVAQLRPGMPETEVAGRIEFGLRQAGGEGLSFDTIVAAGARSALVHGSPSHAPLPRRGFVVLDYGVILGGYVSDMTRTLHAGRPDARAKAVYNTVREAQAAAIAAVKPGASCATVDRAARQIIRKAGWGKNFAHSTGHGVGLEIHEAPRIAATATETLAPGHVITVEPGVYIPGWGGVRIEDVVLVTERGAEVLTPSPKEMLSF
jgi:Xaa-Pro aminopeptidase